MELKSGLLKFLSIIMIVCYVFGPVHRPFFNEIHGVFHFLEEKTSEISHLFSHHHYEFLHEEEHEQQGEFHTHEFLAGKALPKNQAPEQLKEKHYHGVLSFLSAIFGALEHQNSGDETLIPTILDKHSLTFWSFAILNKILLFQQKIWYVTLKTYPEVIDLFDHPPKHIHFSFT